MGPVAMGISRANVALLRGRLPQILLWIGNHHRVHRPYRRILFRRSCPRGSKSLCQTASWHRCPFQNQRRHARRPAAAALSWHHPRSAGRRSPFQTYPECALPADPDPEGGRPGRRESSPENRFDWSRYFPGRISGARRHPDRARPDGVTRHAARTEYGHRCAGCLHC